MSNPTELPDEFNAAYMAHYIQPPEDNEPHAERCRTWWNKGIAAARRAQPEGEAPQAKDTPESMAQSNARFAIDGAIQYGRENRNEPPGTDHWLYEYWNIGRQLAQLGATGWDNVTPAPAATLSPLCGAQHAAAPGALASYLNVTTAQPQIDYSVVSAYADKHRLHFNGLCAMVRQAAAPSAPGTPEAPAAAEKLYASWQHSQPDRCNIPPWRLLAESVKIEWEQRAAAQLDGGQEGSESNG
ncbi:hypothetical protein IFT74_15550 [Oxalobacteraceae sp. CFBP 8755]|nr:hypothetical protein [Oxalobacteraceae sp. CFBP 8755]